MSLLKECFLYRENKVDNKEKLIQKIKEESKILISEEKYDATFNLKIGHNHQIEKLINIILEENIWLLGYDITSKIAKLYNNVKSDNGTWKPDLIIKNKTGVNGVYELKQADDCVLIWDKSHSSYYLSSTVIKGTSQLENQMVTFLNNDEFTKNDELFLIIGNKEKELNNIPQKEVDFY